jgi:hypothetical protein
MGTSGRFDQVTEGGYKVMTVQPGCCTGGNVSPTHIEGACNQMSGQGYKLVVAYESLVGCACCAKKCCVLVFTR